MDPEPTHRDIGLSASVGDASLVLPRGWTDASDYRFADAAGTLSLDATRVRTVRDAPAKPLLDERVLLWREVGGFEDLQERTETVRGVGIDIVEAKIGGEEQLILHGAALKASPEEAVLLLLQGPLARTDDIVRVWRRLLDGVRVRDPRAGDG